MSWKKNGFSYFMWLLYTVAVGSGIFCLVMLRGRQTGYSLPICLLIGCACLLAAGAVVFFLRLFAGAASKLRANKKLSYLSESGLVAALLCTGLFLCIWNFPESLTGDGYYELAKVTGEQGVIQVVHGAVYLYLQLLHIVCLLFGNKIALGVWLQVILYLLAAVAFYFAVRRLAGVVSAIIMLAFMMLSPFLAAEALVLSPNILFLLIYGMALYVASGCLKKSDCSMLRYCVTGIVIAITVYLDIAGITLFVFMLSGMLVRRERLGTLGICFGSAIIGFFGCIALDTVLSGKEFFSVLMAWRSLYSPEVFALPVIVCAGKAYWDMIVLLLIMSLGIFSFRYPQEVERTSVWVLASAALIAMQCFQITTVEMMGFQLLYIFMAVLAGIGICNVFAPAKSASKEMAIKAAKIVKSDTIVKTEAVSAPAAGVRFIENPLPLPKKHVAKTMDYRLKPDEKDGFDYDYPVDENDDFDIL